MSNGKQQPAAPGWSQMVEQGVLAGCQGHHVTGTHGNALHGLAPFWTKKAVLLNGPNSQRRTEVLKSFWIGRHVLWTG